MESSERQEIPACQPQYISRHMRDSGRAFEPVDSFSPQPVLRKPLFTLGSFMDNDTFEEDVDFLFTDKPKRSMRERFCSDTNFSSNMPESISSTGESCPMFNDEENESPYFDNVDSTSQ